MILMISMMLPQRIFKTNVSLQNHHRVCRFFDRRRLAFEQSSKVPGEKMWGINWGFQSICFLAIFGEAIWCKFVFFPLQRFTLKNNSLNFSKRFAVQKLMGILDPYRLVDWFFVFYFYINSLSTSLNIVNWPQKEHRVPSWELTYPPTKALLKHN